jgi:FkbM family methyltransferase
MECRIEIPGMPNPMPFHVHPGSKTFVSRQIFQNSIWEPFETAVIVNHLKPGDVFLDIGANIGYFSVIAAAIVGETGKVIAYEPDERNFTLLKRNLSDNHFTNAAVFQAALSDYHGRGHIYLCDDNEGDHRIYDCGEGRERMDVDVFSGNHHIPEVSRHIDFIKIDTQGSEVHVLRGMDRLLQANADHLSMVIELWPHGLKRSGASGRAFLDMIAGFNFHLFMIDTIGCRLIPITLEGLYQWVADMEAQPENEGFMDLFLTRRQVPEAIIS